MRLDVNEAQRREQLETTAGPHLVEPGVSTARMMRDVLIALAPVVATSIWYYRTAAILQLGVCLVTALAAESLACRLRGRSVPLTDGSAAITAVILALSLPPQLPLYATALGALVAILLGKSAFGGLGYNIFNPAMVGRAFLMACFPAAMTSWTTPIVVHATTEATPLAAAKFSGQIAEVTPLVTGAVAGSLGETSALVILLGGLWLLLRRAGDWRLSAGMLLAVAGFALLESLAPGDESKMGIVRHITSGGVMLGAFFIVTDPVTSPLSKSGRWVFGVCVGLLTMVIRTWAGYPEGVMFAVLIANALTPMINRITIPRPVGGNWPGK